MSAELEHWSSPNGCHEDCPACAANVAVECDNCEFAGCKEDLNDIKDYSERVSDDGPEPEGECPKCGALCYEVEAEPERLTMEQRGKLARDVFAAVFDECETFTEDDVGKDLAYLMGAILDDSEQKDCHVDWTTEVMGSEPYLLKLLKTIYPESSAVWKFIIMDKAPN